MPKKFKNLEKELNEFIENIESGGVEEIKDTKNVVVKERYIPDIITFCESPEYLGLSQRNIYLYLFQRIILKIFYRGSEGNENLSLTEEEINMCKKLDLNSEDRGNVLDKYYNNTIFRELILVWGRRGTKDFVSSIIAVYEAMRLLECPGGNPYSFYHISESNPITILTVATEAKQSAIAFREIKDKIQNSKYFEDKIDIAGWQQGTIRLFTKRDFLKNKELKEKGLPPDTGSIAVRVGHSNSDSLLGEQIFVLILDEVASFKQTQGAASGERILTALTPSLTTFVRTIKEKDENGNEVERKVFDSKLICISSPRGEEGMFYGLYKNGNQQPDRLICRLATWEVNSNLTEEALRKSYSYLNDEEFEMEYGAHFSGMAGKNFFMKEKVEDCFKYGLQIRPVGEPGKVYFAHLDPARNSHNYALIIVHKEMFLNPETNLGDYYIVIDHIKFWSPTADKPIDVEEVDEYMISLKRKFYLHLVTYDRWNSESSIKKLIKHGIPAKCTDFTTRYQKLIYDNLEFLVNSGRLRIPHHPLFKQEMLNLQRKYTENGYKVYAKKEGGIAPGTDDLLDSAAGACYGVVSIINSRLPHSKVVNTGSSPSSNEIVWKTMQGVIGVGTGEQVSRRLEQRNSWPNNRR